MFYSGTTNQLFKNYHVLSQILDTGREIREVFLDFSKAFDNVWHSFLIYKSKKLLITSYLSDILFAR